MSFELTIALRYLKSRRYRFFPSTSAAISAAGITLGVWALIVVLSVMSGFSSDMRDKILGTHSHILIRSHEGSLKYSDSILEDIVNSHPDIVGATPFIYSDVMITSSSSVGPLRLIGINPKTVSEAKELRKYLVDGELKHLVSPPEYSLGRVIETDSKNHKGIILGDALAYHLAVVKGDHVNIVSPLGKMGPMGSLPKMKRFRVVGLFKSGMYDYDSKFGYVSIPAAQKFLEMNDNIGGIEVKVKDIFQAANIGKVIEEVLGYPLYSQDWIALNKNLFSALKLERIMIAILLTCIIIVAAFGIISSLSMLVMEKKRDISILKTMGATKKKVMKIFIYNGFIIGLVGVVIGETTGWLTCVLLQKYKFIELPMDIYSLTTLPVKMAASDFIWIGLVALIISIGATLHPAYKAVNVDPVEGLRNA